MNLSERQSQLFIFLFGGLVFVFLILRAIYVPPYPDEILNFHVYAKPGKFIPFFSEPDANNHFISTFFNWISVQLFGNQVKFMRIFELLSFPFFYLGIIKIGQLLKSKLIAGFMVLTICSSFFILTFFTLARGYGMSMTFMTLAIYFLLLSFKNPSGKIISWSFIFCGLTLWTNLSMSLSVLIIAGLLCWNFLKNYFNLTKKDKITLLIFAPTFGGPPIILAIFYGFYLKSHGALWLGGKEGFLQDVLLNLSYRSLGERGIWWVILLFFSLLVFTLFNWKKFKFQQAHKVIFILTVTTILGTILMHLILGINYPHNRAALHILIISLMAFFFYLDSVKNSWNWISVIPAIVFLGHHIYHINLSYPATWKDSTLDKSLYQCLVEEQSNQADLITINAPFYFGECVHYFNYLEPQRLNNVQWIDYPSNVADYLIVNPADQIKNENQFDTIYCHPVTKVALFKRKTKTIWTDLMHVELIEETQVNTTNSLLGKLKIEPAQTSDYLLSLSGFFQCEKEVDFAAIYFSFYDEAGQLIADDKILLNTFRDSFKKAVFLEKSLFFTQIPPEIITVKIELENPNVYSWQISAFAIELKDHLSDDEKFNLSPF